MLPKGSLVHFALVGREATDTRFHVPTTLKLHCALPAVEKTTATTDASMILFLMLSLLNLNSCPKLLGTVTETQ